MATPKLNSSSEYESLNIFLDPEKYPIAYKAKLDELIRNGMTEDEAKNFIRDCPIELEVYYHSDYGLFALESDAVESTNEVYSPYTGELCEPYDDED